MRASAGMGRQMGKFLFTADYSSASWARLVNSSDDRFATVNAVMESLGGSLEVLYWTAYDGTSHCIADLPDLVAARAFVTATFKTGAFKSVKVEELLTQDQLRDTLVLARSAETFYQAPGQAAVERN